MSEADDVLTIDIVSDVVCPWCYVGEKRLEAALAEEPGPVVVRWRPYQLDPTIPEGGLDRAEYMEKKFGKSGRLQSAHDNLTRLGAEVGVPFAFDKIKRSPNTLDAHRLIRWAASAGVQAEVADRLFKAYFVEGRDIGDRKVLLEIAAECGLDAGLGREAARRGRGRRPRAPGNRAGAGDGGERRAVLHLRRPPRRARRAGAFRAAAGDGAGAAGDGGIGQRRPAASA